MAYEYYNAHPKGLRVNDCVKRAISLAAQMDYMEVSRELNRYKKITGAKSFNSDRNCFKYVEQVLKAKKLSFPAVKGKPRMNGSGFCYNYPKGRYILNMAGHWSCCVDGVIYDTWDCSEKCVYTAYEIIDEKQLQSNMLQELGNIEKEYEQQLAKLKKQYERKIKKIKEKYE